MRVLGQLTVDGTDLARLDRKTRSLLQLLALGRGRPVTADALVEALWGDRPPTRPGDQLAVLVSRLRRELGRDRVERVPGGYRLRADWLDLAELEAVVTEAERRHRAGEVAGALAAARVGLALLRGPVPEPPHDTDWARGEQAAAQRLVRRARRIAAAALLEAGEWVDALELATADSLVDPLDEEAVRTVMRAQVAGGRPGLALAAYATLRETLAEQLGADPAPATAALHTAILRGELAAAVPARPDRPTASLVGRSSQLAHLDALVHRVATGRAPRAALVSGEAGIGKTTLLTHWVAARRRRGERVLLATCRPLDRAAPLDVVLTALGDHLRGLPDPAPVLGPDAPTLAPLLGAGASRPDFPPVDPSLGPSVLYAAVTSVLTRVAGEGCAVLVVDDAHLAGATLGDWLGYLLRRPVPLLVVLGARPAEGPPLPVTDEVGLGPLDRDQVAEVVGVDRADDLYARTGGHPLFLAELATVPAGELPGSLVASVTARCDQLGAAGDLVRTAAVLGGELDVDLLAGVLGRGTLEVLADAELAVRHGLLREEAGRIRFRHELVREALVVGTSPGRAAVLHRAAGVVLSRRPEADPAAVAEHARLGGDRVLAATALRTAAVRAAERYDHSTAEQLLDQSLALSDDDRTRVARARVRIRLGRYAAAEADAVGAAGAGPERWETAAWASYFDRRFDDAIRYADDGLLSAEDERARARCLVASGRILHARGDLAEAESRLRRALALGSGEERLEAAAWLGVLRAHRADAPTALELLRPATRPGVSVDHTSATLHAVLFGGHAHAVEGRPVDALACFARYTEEVARRDVPRFAGRGVNFSGWVLRNLGATGPGVEAHHAALEGAPGTVTAEVMVAALEDLAEARIREEDPEGARVLLDRARHALVGDLVFGWRLAMKLQLLEAQVQLLSGDAEAALSTARGLVASAADAGVPRYRACGRLVEHRAGAALGEPVDAAAAWADLHAAEQAVGVEAWWWAGRTAVDLTTDLGPDRWLRRAEALADRLARASGPHADTLRTEADGRLARWRGVMSR